MYPHFNALKKGGVFRINRQTFTLLPDQNSASEELFFFGRLKDLDKSGIFGDVHSLYPVYVCLLYIWFRM